MMGMTHGTVPFPIRQRQVNLAVVAVVAPLAGGEEGPDRFQATPVPDGFVLQLAQKFAPTRITDGSGQMMIHQHPLHIQALDIDRLALVDQSTALFVKEVRTLVGNFLMQTRHLHPRFLAVLAALLFAGKLALQATQLLFRPAQRLRSIDLLPLRSDDEALQSQIQPDLFPFAFGRTVFHIHFAQDGGEVPARWAAGDGYAFERTPDRAVHHDLERRQLRDGQPTLLYVQREVLRDTKRLLAAPGFELRKLCQALKKVPVRRVQIAQGHLQGLRIDVSQPSVFRLSFQGGQPAGSVLVIQALLLFSFVRGVEIHALTQKEVVHKA